MRRPLLTMLTAALITLAVTVTTASATPVTGLADRDADPAATVHQAAAGAAAQEWSLLSPEYFYTCGLLTDASAWCWGILSIGQFGQIGGETEVRTRPARVGTTNDWTSLGLRRERLRIGVRDPGPRHPVVLGHLLRRRQRLLLSGGAADWDGRHLDQGLRQ